ncbi:MAG: DUF5317 domain-containing protein [Vallitaleaceae bacterium]|jgi:hypothetical protein|nr:DUF5317 domain-containing protein [Vallitaleaceae bacterium]
MFVEAIVVGIIVGFILKGSFENLIKIDIRYWYLIVVAGAVEVITVYIRKNEIEPLWAIVDQRVILIKILIYGLLLFTTIYNHKVPGMWFIITGLFLNGLVILFNGGRMPVDLLRISDLIKPEQIEYMRAGKDLAHDLLVEDTRLKFLADIIHIKRPYPFPKSISIGDIWMNIGVMIMIIKCMKEPFGSNQDRLT